ALRSQQGARTRVYAQNAAIANRLLEQRRMALQIARQQEQERLATQPPPNPQPMYQSQDPPLPAPEPDVTPPPPADLPPPDPTLSIRQRLEQDVLPVYLRTLEIEKGHGVSVVRIQYAGDGSGQSNMALPIGGMVEPPVPGARMMAAVYFSDNSYS